MGANPTQAQAVLLFFVAFTLIAVALATGPSAVYMLLGLALAAVSLVLFLRCKPWEDREQ